MLLVSRKPLGELERVALDENSRTSATLVRILLRERYDVEPLYHAASPEVEKMLAISDAALVIGDPALSVDRERYHIVDLAREWRELTGFPFVFAVKGATRHDILAAFERRIDNPPAQELTTAIENVARIMRFRLEDRVAPT